jgi:hypothetical protein
VGTKPLLCCKNMYIYVYAYFVMMFLLVLHNCVMHWYFHYNNIISPQQVSDHYSLPPGSYVVVPSTFEPEEEGDFIIRVFSERRDDTVKWVKLTNKQGQIHDFVSRATNHKRPWLFNKPSVFQKWITLLKKQALYFYLFSAGNKIKFYFFILKNLAF